MSAVRSRLSAEGLRVMQGETERGRPLGAVTPGEALLKLLHVDPLLEMREAPPRVCTVWSALAALKNLYIRRNRVAAEWRQEARRLGGEAEDAKNRRAQIEREPDGTETRLDTVTEEGAKCRGRLQCWGEWYAYHDERCLVAPKGHTAGTSENRWSTAGMKYAERSGTVFVSPSFGGATVFSPWR